MNIKNLIIAGFVSLTAILALALNTQDQEFYSRAADEYEVEFSAVFKTGYKSLDQIQNISNYQKKEIIEWQIKPTTKYLFGPMTHRQLGGEQKGLQIIVAWDQAHVKGDTVYLPYTYKGVWLVLKNAPKGLDFLLPLPLNYQSLKTEQWRNCTDSHPDHQDYASFWYYWDPERYGCDHQPNVHYQIINPKLLKMTPQTQNTYPQYKSMLEDNVMSMTFAFGYVEDPAQPNPLTDTDYGMLEFRKFVNIVKASLSNKNYKLDSIYESEYLNSVRANQQIGYKFSYTDGGVDYIVKVVAAADIDQMELFAESFAAQHDDYFGWFGHSRVGNGFDADQFASMVRRYPDRYKVTSNYQIIYWAGCNSYSYYTKPFFDFKARYNEADPTGTKSLDIISNGLPSYFSLNAANAAVLLNALIQPNQPTSYQSIVNKIEKKSNQYGINVLVNILGDEDNEP